MKFRTKLFDPACTSVMTMRDPHRMISKLAGLNEQPCLKALLPTGCRCCLQFDIAPFGGTAFNPSSPFYDDSLEFCTEIVGHTVTLTPIANELDPVNGFCHWRETTASQALRGTANPYTNGVSYGATWTVGSKISVRYGSGGAGQWETAISNGPCFGDPIELIWVAGTNATPFNHCSGGENQTITLRSIVCDTCDKGLAKYTAVYPATSWTLIANNCDKSCSGEGACRPWSSDEIIAAYGPIVWDDFSHTPKFIDADCRCD